MPVRTWPSPQLAKRHNGQPPVSTLTPSSHCSLPVTSWSPQVAASGPASSVPGTGSSKERRKEQPDRSHTAPHAATPAARMPQRTIEPSLGLLRDDEGVEVITLTEELPA